MFNNPYLYGIPSVAYTSRIGTIGNLFRNINLSSILTNTSKTLNVINQAIPIVTQVKPIIDNAKTMFKIAGAINTPDDKTTTTENIKQITSNGPIFFI